LDINSLIHKTIQQGIGKALLDAISLKFSKELEDLELNLSNKLNNL
jgi:hypothetical protein